MAVRIRMKKMGRTHRPYFRICAIDKRSPRDGRVLEELGTYDPMIADTDARAQFNKERVDYWISVGAQPSEKCAVLIKKYGTDGTHVSQQEAALEKLAAPKTVPDPGAPASLPKPPEEEKPEQAKTEDAPADEAKPEQTAAKPEDTAAKPEEALAKPDDTAAKPEEAADEAKPEEPSAEKPAEEAASEEKPAAETAEAEIKEEEAKAEA